MSKKSVQRAAQLLKMGALVAFPTETVYGLGARLFDPQSISQIFQVKGRPSDNPLIAHVACKSDYEKLADWVPDSFHLLAEAFFPGPLTLIVSKCSRVPHIATGGLETVAVRCPDHPLARTLIQLVGEPLVAPSANLSGRPSSTLARHVLSDFRGKIAAVLDGGPCLHGLESTVVDLVSFDQPTLMRPGTLSKEVIESVIGMPIALYSYGPKSSPGMKYRHYSPEIPVYLFSDRGAFEKHLVQKKKVFAISSDELQGKTLYALLRLAEESGCDHVAIDKSLCRDSALLHRLEKMVQIESDLN